MRRIVITVAAVCCCLQAVAAQSATAQHTQHQTEAPDPGSVPKYVADPFQLHQRTRPLQPQNFLH